MIRYVQFYRTKIKYKKTHLVQQILSITTDNAFNNDKMLVHLGNKLDDFAGTIDQTRCFAHTLNLTAKVIIKQFDIPKTSSDGSDSLEDAAENLSKISLELEDNEQAEQDAWEIEDDDSDDKNLTVADWLHFHEELLGEGINDWDEAVQPVRSTLFKVH